MKLIAGLIAVVVASCSYADSFPETSGYLIDERGIVVRNSYSECVHTGYWTPQMAIAQCDPDLIKKPEEKVAKIPHVVAAPVPAALPAALPPVRLSTEMLFDFDRSDVKPQGEQLLNEKIVEGLKLRQDTVLLSVTGHADRIGTKKYNQDLSERRAYAVKAYLLKKGIPAQHIRASGKGESEPDPLANTIKVCRGLTGEKLIACLQPDRRVTVESE